MMAMHDLKNAGLGAVLKTALDAVVVMRMDGTIAGWNDVAESTFGWSFAEAHGRRMSEMIIPERFRNAHEAGLAHFCATGEGPILDKHFEIEAAHRDGHELPVELSITRTTQFGEPVFLGFLRDISERRDAVRRQNLMVGELNHRVKNLLGVVSAIAHQTARASASLDDFTPAFIGRLASLGKAHEILAASTWERAPLRALAEQLVGSYALGPQSQASIHGPDVLLSPRQLLSVSMILHELLTNAIKYGALSVPTGQISLWWQTQAGRLDIHWVETGVADVEPPLRTGFGSKMIALAISHELRGESMTEWREDGMTCSWHFSPEDGASK